MRSLAFTVRKIYHYEIFGNKRIRTNDLKTQLLVMSLNIQIVEKSDRCSINLSQYCLCRCTYSPLYDCFMDSRGYCTHLEI